MIFNLDAVSPIFRNPFFWTTLGGACVGAALAALTVIPSRKRSPSAARTRKWVAVCIALSLFVLTALVAALSFSPRRFLQAEVLYYFAGAAILFFLALRFRKTVGILLVVLILLTALAWIVLIGTWEPVTAETVVLEYKVLAGDSDQIRIEYRRPSDDLPDFANLPPEVTLGFTLLRFDDKLWIGSGTWYQLTGLRGENPECLALCEPMDTTRYGKVADAALGWLENKSLITRSNHSSSALPVVLLEPWSLMLYEETIIFRNLRAD